MNDQAELVLEEQERRVAANPDWITLTSVGIDIGSTTSHLMFSRLLLKRQGLQLSGRFSVAQRRLLYRSPVVLTPYQDTETIDIEQLSTFMAQSYRDAGLDPSDIDTGAAICTGEAVRKKNAEAITRMFSDNAGRFVCATAGPHLEGILAAHGSGAVTLSQSRCTVMNIDVGGGTSKVAIIRDGAVLDTGSINVGARLVAWDSDSRLVRVEQAGRRIAESLGIGLELGHVLSESEKRALAAILAESLFEYLLLERKDPISPLTSDLMITGSLAFSESPDEVVFSGGVSEYIYGRETGEYGDLGLVLGEEIRKRIPSLGASLAEGSEGIRATVIGASQYTVQVSGSTIFLSRPEILPLCDYQVVKLLLDQEQLMSADSVAQAIGKALGRLASPELEQRGPVALAIHGKVEPSYNSLRLLATGIALALQPREIDPWVLVFDTDISGLVGTILKSELAVPAEVVAVDEIDVADLDFIDIGQELDDSQVVPVVVKSLVFG